MPAKNEHSRSPERRPEPLARAEELDHLLSPLKIDFSEFRSNNLGHNLVSLVSPPPKVPAFDLGKYEEMPQLSRVPDSQQDQSILQDRSSEDQAEASGEVPPFAPLDFTARKKIEHKNLETPRAKSRLQPLSHSRHRSRNRDSRRKQLGVACHCKKSRCLKFYCDCFTMGQVCGQNCQCFDCHNNEQHQHQRTRVISIQKERNPRAFDPKVLKDEQVKHHARGCNCKRSGCEKGYCECYQAGVKCTHLCKCQLCKNMGGGARMSREVARAGEKQKVCDYDDECWLQQSVSIKELSRSYF